MPGGDAVAVYYDGSVIHRNYIFGKDEPCVEDKVAFMPELATELEHILVKYKETLEMLHKYADSVGFIYDGWGQVRTDGLKTFNTSPETGLISLYFNNGDDISIIINGLGKKSEYSIGLCKAYAN